MIFVDTHCHITDESFGGKDAAVNGEALGYIQRANAAGVQIMIQADVDSSERGAMLDLVRRFPKELRAMIGLYPGSVKENWRDEIAAMTKAADSWEAEGRAFAAMGEIGLDYHEGKEYAAEQKEALAWQLEYASRNDLPVNIHLRDAIGDFLDVIKAHKSLNLRGNMHCYSGSYESFMELSRMGDWYIGVGGVVTFRNASMAEVVRRLPLDRIVLETDAPYLAPVPYRGTRNESSYIPAIASKIAEIKGTSVGEVAETTTNNAYKLFKIK
jgi:TatD DNase family protein